MAVEAVVAMVVEGDMEVPPHLGGHQDFKEDQTIEGVAFEDVGHRSGDAVEPCTAIILWLCVFNF